MLVSGDCLPFEVWIVLPLLRAELLDNPSIWLTFAFFEGNLIPVEKEDPFTRLGQNFFLSSHTEQRGYVMATTQALSFTFSPPLFTTLCVYAALSFLSFPITHRSFLIYPHLWSNPTLKLTCPFLHILLPACRRRARIPTSSSSQPHLHHLCCFDCSHCWNTQVWSINMFWRWHKNYPYFKTWNT